MVGVGREDSAANHAVTARSSLLRVFIPFWIAMGAACEGLRAPLEPATDRMIVLYDLQA